jgi:hypothetical protein
LEKTIYPGDKLVMFITYASGEVQTRYFDHPRVLDAWMKTMNTLKALQVVEKFNLFELSEFPPNAVVTQ